MTNRRELADRLEAIARLGYTHHEQSSIREAARLLREPVAGEVEAVLRRARWYVNDHQEAQPNDEARDDLAAIDALLEHHK